MANYTEEITGFYAITRNHDFETSKQSKMYPGLSEADWRKAINKEVSAYADDDAVQFVALVFHDKDVKEDGETMKPLHAHIAIQFKEKQERSWVQATYKVSRRANAIALQHPHRHILYFTHATDQAIEDGKQLYAPEDVTVWGSTDYAGALSYEDLAQEAFWEPLKDLNTVEKRSAFPETDSPYAMSEMTSDGFTIKSTINYYSGLVRSGDYTPKEAEKALSDALGYYYARQQRDMLRDDELAYASDKLEEIKRHGSPLANIYIMGPGGIGKTYLAKELGNRLADKRGVHVASAPGVKKTPDALDGYIAEKVMIFNEMSPTAFTVDEFNDCFDPHYRAPFPSRNKNKGFIGDTVLMTNSLSPLRFAKNIMLYSPGGKQYRDKGNPEELNAGRHTQNKYWQVRRRFKVFIVLTRSETDENIVDVAVFKLRPYLVKNGEINNESGTHVLAGMLTYYAEREKEPEMTDDFFDELQKLQAVNVATSDYDDAMVIDDYIAMKGLEDEQVDEVMEGFLDDVVQECVWDLLPTKFLYALYKSYRAKYYDTSDSKVMTIREFTQAFDNATDEWELGRARSASKMDADEPLITAYGLDRDTPQGPSPWINQNYWGTNKQDMRNFPRQTFYRGFIKVTS